MAPKETKRENALQISRRAQPAFRAIIVDRDSMSSGLLADALARGLSCDAVALRSSQLLQALGTRPVDLVAISADLNGREGDGLELVKACLLYTSRCV